MSSKTSLPDSPSTPREPRRRPRVALFIATACGLGYIPLAPGTFGSLGGLIAAVFPLWAGFACAWIAASFGVSFHKPMDPVLTAQAFLAAFIAMAGVLSAGRAARFWGEKDPQRVVIDEVSGQHLALLLGCSAPLWRRTPEMPASGYLSGMMNSHAALNWKYLLLGLILFRAFDIWKPFPVRKMESLPGGWGIMADDWAAGIYAAAGLWVVRALGF